MFPKAECVFFLLLLLQVRLNCGKEVIWKYDTDISNPDNWVNGKLGVDCKGLHFAEINSAPVLITTLTTEQLVLPKDGIVEFDNGFVEFKDNQKCIQLKQLDYHDWYNPTSWRLTNENSAIPDKEKVPCKTDQVYFPNLVHSAISGLTDNKIPIKSIRADKNEALERIIPNFYIAQDCQDPYGCICHTEAIICPEITHKLKCKNPVYPEETCHEICGAYITYKAGSGPKLKNLEQKLQGFKSDTYFSRVRNFLGDDLIQIVFSEKDYTGSSLEEAEKFWETLQNSKARQLQIYKSGHMEQSGHTFGIIFGSLMGVLAFFGILFCVNGDAKTEILSRWSRRQGSVFSVPFFARFDNIDENLIVDGSESGSILDIAKSFDNPMFGKTPTTCKPEIHHENPLYEATKDIEE